jgi:tRNA threonylcarbamoyladenosine biosynthesis protein TsaB
MILGIETSSSVCSVAFWNGQKFFSLSRQVGNHHSAELFPMLNELFNQAGTTLAQTQAVACGIGPGSFTGIRIAVAVAQGISLAHQIPLLAFDALEALAHEVVQQSNVSEAVIWSVIDARLGEFYAACYEWREGALSCLSSPSLWKPADWLVAHQSNLTSKTFLVGSGVGLLPAELLGQRQNKEAVAEFGLHAVKPRFERQEFIAPTELSPLYLRNKIALTEEERQAVKQANLSHV